MSLDLGTFGTFVDSLILTYNLDLAAETVADVQFKVDALLRVNLLQAVFWNP